jgi:DNA-binding MarR family transcriptional regulator
MSRELAVEDLYQQLATFVRRSRELSNDLHPGMSLVAYTFLGLIDTTPGLLASDLASRFGLDKSTVSRQLDQLMAAGLLSRQGGRPGRRGDPLSLTPVGRRELAIAADGVRMRLAAWLDGWEDGDVAAFAEMMGRLNAALR